MTRPTDVDVALKRAEPLVHQCAPEIQVYGRIVRMPIALSESLSRSMPEAFRHAPSPSRRIALIRGSSLDAVAGSEFVDDRIRL
jgi:hypothetical protein